MTVTLDLAPDMEAFVTERAVGLGLTPDEATQKFLSRELRRAMQREKNEKVRADSNKIWAEQDREWSALSDQEKEFWRQDYEDLQRSLRESRAAAREECDAA